MTPILLQVAFLAVYLCVVIFLRRAARERLAQRAEEERERQEALEREWKVGIPYDPSPDAKSRERRW